MANQPPEDNRLIQNPFVKIPRGSTLDPSSPNFNAKEWFKKFAVFMSHCSPQPPSRVGVSFKNLNVYGEERQDYQKTVFNVLLGGAASLFRWIAGTQRNHVHILDGFHGLVESGELLLVLGRPGSGCSTFLKIISGDTYGVLVADESSINYQGMPALDMRKHFRGEAIYMAETDMHFPQLTVGQTLLFAAKARSPRKDTLLLVNRQLFAEVMRDVTMATFGLSHTVNTNVGSALVPGVSGGERKRVSIAEAALSRSPLQCWDNSTRGLDSANALEFCRALRTTADCMKVTALVSLYQSSEKQYELFDKVMVLYEGKQIYFGPTKDAKAYFFGLGFVCGKRQTTADFLTSLTNPAERKIQLGCENEAPRTADEFHARWKTCSKFYRLLKDIEKWNKKYPLGGNSILKFMRSRRSQQSKVQTIRSPYTISVYHQIKFCVERGFWRMKGDASMTIARIGGNGALALIIGSLFYNLDETTASFTYKGALIFLAVSINAFASALEIVLLFEQRPVVEKHSRYALYQPFAEAISSSICDMTFKIVNALAFNLLVYFMTNLHRTSRAFFTFLLFSFSITMCLSMAFRTLGAASRTLSQALCPSAIVTLVLMVYTGFIIPVRDMKPWLRWISYINPMAYAFESLMINEFDGRYFRCPILVPSGPEYANIGDSKRICATVGATAGSDIVSGTVYLQLVYDHERSHLWRNLGIIFAFTVFFTATYLGASEHISGKKSKGDVLLFKHGKRKSDAVPDIEQPQQNPIPDNPITNDVPTEIRSHRKRTSVLPDNPVASHVPAEVNENPQLKTSVLHWKDICYAIQIRKEVRMILNYVDGWVKPGTLTALMGPSGAGKTTLLDVLATRDTVGIPSGQVLVNGRQRHISFQRKTRYAQQADIHLETMTVRESLQFQALLCQSAKLARLEKLNYVEEVIRLLSMDSYADAVIGVPGEGLNVEQRKKLTIAVELASRPELLLFLDEPSSGLDSQTAWAVMSLLQKLKSQGQAILCTIHQPSAMLFERFDRLLFLASEGKTVYFGEIGEDSSTVVQYFERNGAEPCPQDTNPADWMMEVIGCSPGSRSEIDWPEVWKRSPEYAKVQVELNRLEKEVAPEESESSIERDNSEFAASYATQLYECLIRVNLQYWRTPSYIYAKLSLCVLTALFLGVSFYRSENTLQGLQNQSFNIFMLLSLGCNLIPQILPNFVTQRAIYEARERPAKTYSWQVFMVSNILVELPWNTLMALLIFICWYYPVGWHRNAQYTGMACQRGFTVFLYLWQYMMYASTFAHMIQAGIELAEMAGNFANLVFIMSLIFSGILVGPDIFPRFWIFMYRISPFSYTISGMLSTNIANAPARCSSIEYLRFSPPPSTTCHSYLQSFIKSAGGYVANPMAATICEYCPISDASSFLELLHSNYHERWTHFGIGWVYVVINAAMALALYWFFRVPRKAKNAPKKQVEMSEEARADGVHTSRA